MKDDVDWNSEEYYHAVTDYMKGHKIDKKQRLTLLMNLLIDVLTDREELEAQKEDTRKLDVEKVMMDFSAFVKRTEGIIEQLNDTIHDSRRMRSLEEHK